MSQVFHQETGNDSEQCSETKAQPPIWLRASVADLEALDFEQPIAGSKSADSRQMGDLFRAAAGDEDASAAAVFGMLAAAAGMMLRPEEKNEPFGPMLVLPDGRRSPAPSDFRGQPEEVLATAAQAAKHPALRARLTDLCWVLDRKKGKLGSGAVAAYTDVVKRVDDGLLTFPFDEGQGALKHDARGLLRRAPHVSSLLLGAWPQL